MAAVGSSGANLVSASTISKGFGTRVLLADVSLGIAAGEVIGVVGRNGDGKSTLLRLLIGREDPDTGQVTHAGSASIGYLDQDENISSDESVRDLILDGAPDHVWAADPYRRSVVTQLLGDIDLDANLHTLSGGMVRRAALVQVMLGDHNLLVLDEPTNHLDLEAVQFLAEHLNELHEHGVALLIVSHDRWFLDEVCDHIWDVHDGQVDSYDGGYGAYVLARAERARLARVTEERRQNLLRKELAWLQRGARARSSKPKFRIAAAAELTASEPPPRDQLELKKFATARLGKDVIEFKSVTFGYEPTTPLFRNLDFVLGPGDRIGLMGANGSGKTTLLNLMDQRLRPTGGHLRFGKTLRLAHLSQHMSELDPTQRVLESVERVRAHTKLQTGKEASADVLASDFGFSGGKLHTRIGELSGGERRRLQFLRLLLAEPNVLLLDEPTNDLDIDTLTVLEDYLDTWCGTLVVATHDRHFLERVTDVAYALEDQTLKLLPGGVDEYLAHRRTQLGTASSDPHPSAPSSAAQTRIRRKELNRLESQLEKTNAQILELQTAMSAHASDFAALTKLNEQLSAAQAKAAELEDQWYRVAEQID